MYNEASYSATSDTPPLAYPSSSTPSTPTSFVRSFNYSSDPWKSPPVGGTFLLSGSTAPRSVQSRKSPAKRGNSYSLPPSRNASSSSLREFRSNSDRGPPVLMTSGKCCCCDTEVRWPRDSEAYECGVCRVTNDLPPRKTQGSSPLPTSATDSVSAEDILKLSERFSPPPPSCPPSNETDEQLARRLHELELASTTRQATLDEAQEQLIDYLVRIYDSPSSLDASFHSISPPTSTPPLHPSLQTLDTFYSLIRSKTEVMEMLRAKTEALLRRPGAGLKELSGSWIVALLESPVFSSEYNPDSAQRRFLYSHFIGLLSNLPNAQHHHLVTYLSSPSYPSSLLLSKIESICSHLSLTLSSLLSSSQHYTSSWQVRSSAKIASLFLAARNGSERHREKIELSSWYVSLIDGLHEEEWIEDFLTWEEGDSQFSLCQYPFLLSLGIKNRLLEFDNQRQIMDATAAAYRTSTSTGYETEEGLPLLVLNIRRNRLVEDSLHQISSNRANLRKSLRLMFEDEEGIDAGGLRKEWFLLLCRSLFSPSFGMFTPADPDSQLCWFNPGSVGMVEEEDYWLLGAVVGLACYHCDTLDIPLPLVTYKKLMGEFPTSTSGANPGYTLSDLREFRPPLARGLQQLLDYTEDDVEEVFSLNFVGTYEAWGEIVEVELCEGGTEMTVNSENRQEYVSLLLTFILDTSISTQFSAFSAGFKQVCSGNALSLLKGEELELIVRGSKSDEGIKFDVELFKSITSYHGFDPEYDEVIQNFWSIFEWSLSAKQQRQLLHFITSSDRLPSTGITSLSIKITCLGRQDSDRLPISHTCFNELGLWNYQGREKLEKLLTKAIEESEGFGLR